MRTRLLISDLRFATIGLLRSGFPLLLTFLFPFLFLVLFNLIGDPDGREGTELNRVQFTTAAVAVFTVATATYFNLPIALINAREKGLLRRVYVASPSPIVHLVSRFLLGIGTSIISILIATFLSAIFFGLSIDGPLVFRFFMVTIPTGITFSAAGVLLANHIKNIEGALVAYSATLFPLLFVSGVFIPLQGLQGAITTAVKLLPFYWAGELARWVYRPAYELDGGLGQALAVLAVWSVVGIVLTARRFTWTPHAG